MLKRLTIPTLLIMLSSGAQALTLGQIHVHSFINQPLKATIDLQDVKTGELAALKIKLASRTDFKNAGVDWSKQLENLSFSIIQSNKGPAIRVTSRKAVVEPFLSFVVDAKWANGKMVKDFTLLLDPPLYSGKKAAAIDVADAASVTATRPVQSAKIKPPPQPQPQKQSQKQGVSPSVPQEKATATSAGRSKAGSAAQRVTGPTLWQAALKVRPAGATMQQTMVAIHEENPESFIRGNMNLLKKDQMMRIPSAEVIQGISRREAKERMVQHERAFKAGKPITSSKRLSPEIMTQAVEPEPAPAETPARQTATTVTPPSSAGSGGRLRLVSAADDISADAVSGDPASGGADLSTEVDAGKENNALRSRVALLEKQLEVAHKLIRMKGELAQLQNLYRQIDVQRGQADTDQTELTDEQLLLLADAAEQTVAGESDQEPLSVDDARMKDDAIVAGSPEPQQTPSAVEKSEEAESSPDDDEQLSATAAGDEDPVASDEAPAEDAASSAATAEEQQSGSLATETERVASREESATPSTENQDKDAAAAPAARPDSIIEGINNDLLFGVGGVAVLGLLLTFLLGRRGGKKHTRHDLAHDDANPVDESLTEVKLAGESSGASQESKVESVSEPSDVDEAPAKHPTQEFTAQFKPPEPLSIEEPVALDPLELVTVLMRKGENRQAQEVLRQAIEEDPARVELHMQLIKSLHADKDRHAFEAEMNLLETGGFNIEPGDWHKIERMHADLLSTGMDSTDVVSQKHSDAEIINLDFGAAENSGDEDVADAGKQSDSDLEEALRAFEMVLEDKKSDELLPEAGVALDETASILDNPVVSAMPGAEIVEDLELEDDLAVDESAVPDQGVEVISLDDSFGIDSHINSDFDDVFTESADEEEKQSDTLTPGEEDTLPIAEFEALSITSFDTDPSTLKHAELDAKIDLAAAFADMGDVDGAKGILDEVMSEGSQQQQQAAQEMLKKYL